MQTLQNPGIDEPYINLLEEIYSGPTATIVLHKKSDRIPIKKGVRQGNTISPMLFPTCLQEVFRILDWEELGIRVNGEYLSNHGIVLMSNSDYKH